MGLSTDSYCVTFNNLFFIVSVDGAIYGDVYGIPIYTTLNDIVMYSDRWVSCVSTVDVCANIRRLCA